MVTNLYRFSFLTTILRPPTESSVCMSDCSLYAGWAFYDYSQFNIMAWVLSSVRQGNPNAALTTPVSQLGRWMSLYLFMSVVLVLKAALCPGYLTPGAGVPVPHRPASWA
eukprot:1158727-Pelagomonas_calceolata.AAC.1